MTMQNVRPPSSYHSHTPQTRTAVVFAEYHITFSSHATPLQVRSIMLRDRFTKFDDAGWHCSFFRFARSMLRLGRKCDEMFVLSGTEGVIAKIEAFAHQEFNNDGMHSGFL